MIRRINRYLIMLTLAAVAVTMESTPSRAEHTESFEASPGQKLVMDFDSGGSATVEGWDKDLVEITYSDRLRDLDDYDIDVKETRSGLKITASLGRHRDGSNALRFEIRVPREFDVEFESAGGSLTLVDLEGTFTGKTMGGSLELKNMKGEVRLTTMGGSVNVTNCELDGKIHTYGGSCLVENVSGALEVTSSGGAVKYRNVRDRAGDMRAPRDLRAPKGISRKTVFISTMGGSVDVEDAPDGANVYTAGGSITVTGAARFVEATTGGGDVDIRVENGWVQAKTGAGDINVIIDGDGGDEDESTVLITGHGDIHLTVPRGFSMDLDLDVGFTRNSDRDFRIVTDFDIDEEVTTKWDYSNGSPRKHIYGTGTIAGGRYKIKIRTVNGNIYLREGK